jgi:AcrR family transcriptional regulator
MSVSAGERERPPGLRERKKQRTRQLIAEVALALFVERGFEAVTMADIAARADVDTKTIYNYFDSKPDLVFHRLRALETALVEAVRERERGESVVSAYGRFLLGRSGLLRDDEASDRLRAISRMIVESPALLAQEQQVFAGFTAALASVIAEETQTKPSDVRPWVVANALTGFHHALVEYVRRATLAGTPNRQLLRDVRGQARRALAVLERGLAGYGVKRR